jgi:pSer/pThr/pTyr-binding forkhead associated (FHA) protein
MFTQSGERRDFEINPGKTTIGRNGECGIQIKLGVVSRRHCQIIVRDNKVKVRDLGSSNGTYVNNRRIQEVSVGAGETLTVGPVIFTVVIDDMPADIKTVRTIVEPKRDKKSSSGPKPMDDSDELQVEIGGGFDLVEEHEEEEEDEEEVEGHNPLAELAELSKAARGK